MRLFPTLLIAALVPAFGKEIIGYYPAWQWYDRNHLVSPTTLPYDKVTIINYAFFHPLADGSLTGTDSWADDNVLKGEPDWVNGGYKAGTSLTSAAHARGVKVMLSIGGWTLSTVFPSIAASPSLRSNFANACAKAITDYEFDGIDIDWEYPGYADHGGTAADKVNYTLLLQAIRTRLNTLGAANGKRYLLTAALPAGPTLVANIEVAPVSQILDYLNIMTYDFFGAWDPITGHNSPLYSQSQGDPAFSLDAAYRLYRSLGVPGSKLNVGAAFYGRSFAGATALYGTHSGADGTNFSADEGTPMYYNILAAMRNGGWARTWDNQTKTPYILNAGLRSMVSYDDEQSVDAKAQYVLDNDAAGVIIWEITGDYLDDRSTPLLDRLNAAFQNPNRVDGRGLRPWRKNTGMSIFPLGSSPVLFGTESLGFRDALGRRAIMSKQ